MWPSGQRAGLDPASWDALAGSCFYSSSAWLEFCGRDPSGVVGAVHAEAGGGMAAVPVADIGSEPMEYYRWHELLAGYGLPAPAPAGLLVGPRRGYQTHLLASPGVAPQQAAGLLLDRLLQLRDEVGAGLPRPGSCIAMYVTTPDVIALRRAGVRTVPVLLDADAWIPVPDGGWNAWLAGLPRGRRWNARHEAKLFREAGYTVTRTTLLESYSMLAPVWAPNQVRYGHPADVDVLTEKLRVQAEAMGSAAQVLLCRRGDDDPVGFCLFYQWRDTVFMRIAGFDYARLRGVAEYFNVSCYAHVERAPETGIRQIHAGIKSIEAKALRGARLRPLWLLDLSDDSLLLGHDEAIRRHNSSRYQELSGSSPAVHAAMDHQEWLPFCDQAS